GLDLPDRRAVTGFVANLAAGIDAADSCYDCAVLCAGGTDCGEPARSSQKRAESLRNAVPHLVGEDCVIGECHIAVGLEYGNVSVGRGHILVLVVGHGVGEKNASV